MLKRALLVAKELKSMSLLKAQLIMERIESDMIDSIELIYKKLAMNDYSLLLLFFQDNRISDLLEIRRKMNIPIIVVSSYFNIEEKILYLKAGADEYFSEPADYSEIAVKAHVLVRRFIEYNPLINRLPKVMEYKNFVLNDSNKAVYINNSKIEFTATEYGIIYYLLKNHGMVMSRECIYEAVWGDLYDFERDTLDVHMYKIRKKIKMVSKEGQYIFNVRRLGFRFGE